MTVQTLSARLSTGTIHVEIEDAAMPADALFGFAERCNPKRAFLFVSKVLGRHIPVSPAAMRASFKALAARIPADLPGPVLVTGMAETAIGLGAGVHEEYAARRPAADAVYLCTTRHALGLPLMAEFQEEHSHATRHLLHVPADPTIAALVRQARSLIMVDDEASTGKTFANLHEALTGAGLDRIERVVLATLTDWSDGQAEAMIPGRVQSISLLSGRYRWDALPGAAVPAMPPVAMPAAPIEIRPEPARDWGRLGVIAHADTPDLAAGPGQKILVIGTGEHVWQPFRIAEKLERQGAKVHYGSVTRSPIATGHAIGRGLSFVDNYGMGVVNHLYNVDPQAYDRVILCSETPLSAIDPALIRGLTAGDRLPEIVEPEVHA